jgi:hypothetical protein
LRWKTRFIAALVKGYHYSEKPNKNGGDKWKLKNCCLKDTETH